MASASASSGRLCGDPDLDALDPAGQEGDGRTGGGGVEGGQPPGQQLGQPDSASPHVRRVRLRIVAVTPARATRSGMTARSTISRISWGTPGTA